MTELTQVGLITQIEQLVVPYRQLVLWSLITRCLRWRGSGAETRPEPRFDTSLNDIFIRSDLHSGDLEVRLQCLVIQ